MFSPKTLFTKRLKWQWRFVLYRGWTVTRWQPVTPLSPPSPNLIGFLTKFPWIDRMVKILIPSESNLLIAFKKDSFTFSDIITPVGGNKNVILTFDVSYWIITQPVQKH